MLCLAREWAYIQVDWWGIIRGDRNTWRHKCENWERGERDCKSEFSHWECANEDWEGNIWSSWEGLGWSEKIYEKMTVGLVIGCMIVVGLMVLLFQKKL